MDSYHLSSHYAQAYYGHESSSTTNGAGPPPSAVKLQSSHGSWFQPGNNKCTHPGCKFIGSAQSLEIHRMDRHLIHPPNWDQQQPKSSQWDADPSLKGKPIPIQGTSVSLDDPEILAAWIAERKTRWPTENRVADKKRKVQEALDRGQLCVGLPVKRRHETTRPNLPTRPKFAPRKRSRIERTGEVPTPTPVPSTKREDSDSDEPPETVSTKDQPRFSPKPALQTALPQQPQRRPTKPARKQAEPKAPIRNSFATPPALLRNLLLPEIHITISNLSQALRFIVDNDFLEDVELNAGDAENTSIQVLDCGK